MNIYNRAEFTRKPEQDTNFFKKAVSAVMYRAKHWSLGVVCGVTAFPFQMVLACITSHLANQVIENDAKPSGSLPFTTGVILVPILEELVFRGAVQGGLEYLQNKSKDYLPTCIRGAVCSPKTRVIGTALLFGALHLTNTKNGFFGAVVQSMMAALSSAAIAGTLKEKTGTVFSSVGVHMANNFCVWGILRLLQRT